MTMISLSDKIAGSYAAGAADKIAGLRRFLVHAALFLAVVTVGFAGLLTIDRQLASSTCDAECSQGAGSGDDMAAILRE
jgi:hypothetical protein